jgi:hypothetical protein
MHTTLYALRKEPFELDYQHLPAQMSRCQWDTLLAGVQDDSELAETLAEWSSALDQSSELITLSGPGAAVVFASCRARCQVAAFEVGDCDFFFADLAANPPAVGDLSETAQIAWEAFVSVVDVGAMYRSGLPPWLQQAAWFRCAYAGLLTPAAVSGIVECRAELREWLVQAWPSAALFKEDIDGLLDLMTTAARGHCWVLGWEPGT